MRSIVKIIHNVIARNPEGMTKQSVVKERRRSSIRDCFVTPPGFPRNDVFRRLLLLIALVIGGCEQIAPTDDLPYVNHLVIKGFLLAGQPLDSISITHTLPLSVSYDSALAATTSARVTVTVDGRVIPMTYLGGNYFSDPNSDTVQSGKSYHLTVDWNGLHAESTTLVPAPPIVDSCYVGQTITQTYPYETYVYYLTPIEFGIRPQPNTAYSILYDSISAFRHPDDTITDASEWGPEFNEFSAEQTLPPDPHVWLIHQIEVVLTDPSSQKPPIDSLFRSTVIVGSFDPAYANFEASNNNSNSDGIFGVTGTNPKWNVTGDGIGLFIGMASSRASFVVRR